MRILFTTFPALGHLHPVVPLALAAQAAGHDVRLASGPDIVGWARSCGLDAYPVGPSGDEAAATANRDFAGPARTEHMFTTVWVPPALSDLRDFTADWRPDLIVHEEQEYAGVLLAAIHAVPCITQSWAAPARPRAARKLETSLLAPTWQAMRPGAPPRRTGELYLDACPPPFQTPDLDDIAQSTRVLNIRPGLFDGPPRTPPDFLTDLPRPAVYATLGTVAVFSTPLLLARIVSALAPQFAAVIVTTGPNPVQSLGDLPGNVHARQYLPQSQVMPRVDLLVSHGGAGGTISALSHGLAHLVLPGGGQSQLTIAAALHRLGAGLRLSDDQRKPTHIAAAAQRLRTEPGFADAARQIRTDLHALPGPTQVLTTLEASFA